MINSIKQMMNGLSAQYAGEYLSDEEKDKILKHVSIREQQGGIVQDLTELKSNVQKYRKNHIAILCDDGTDEKVLDYVLDNSSKCVVDILFHGSHKQTNVESFYKKAHSSLNQNKVDIGLVKLVHDSIEEISDYILNQRALQYLVTDAHDQLIKLFLKDKLINRQTNIPIVLIN